MAFILLRILMEPYSQLLKQCLLLPAGFLWTTVMAYAKDILNPFRFFYCL